MKQDNSFVYPALFILLTDRENVLGTIFRRWKGGSSIDGKGKV
nr:MAG TPA: hypothetical protein [Bacteriophage sp.]